MIHFLNQSKELRYNYQANLSRTNHSFLLNQSELDMIKQTASNYIWSYQKY